MQDIAQHVRHARQVHMPAEGDEEEARPKKKQRRLQRAGACGYCMALQAPVPTPSFRDPLTQSFTGLY